MRADRWEQIQRLFVEVDELDEDQRRAILDERCAGDPELRDEVESLLGAAGRDGDRIGQIVGAGARVVEGCQARSAAGRLVGPYRIKSLLGQGGMGAVYLAERADEQFEKQVAIKIVRERLARPDLVDRFVAERQILATLEHPHIARLLDGGTTDDGSPFVVMEHVEGLPLDAYCEKERLRTSLRLELFCAVCDAVQYAHRNLIVHRDIKPSNILVTADGVPKLLDFGIAKLVAPEAGRDTERTRSSEIILTPEYASPEQIRGEPVTTASDVYSLGVVLYRLLTGRRPYRLAGAAPGELARAVCEQEPERPSKATGPRTPGQPPLPGRSKELAGDLDNIVLKALSKEPGRRYATAAQLADDIRRYLDGLPVTARPSTWTYRAGKFVKRNRVLVASATAVAVALVVGTATATTMAVREARQRAEAERQTAIANAVNRFLNDDLLAQADPFNQPDREITLREVVDQAAAQVGDRFQDQPLVQAAIRFTLGQTYESLGEFEEAALHYRVAAGLREERLGTEDEKTIETWIAVAGVHYLQGQNDETVEVLERVLTTGRAALAPDHPLMLKAMNTLALVYDAQGRTNDAIEAFREAVAMHRRVLGVEDAETLTAMNNLALVYSDHGRFEESEPLLVEVLEVRREFLGDEHPDTIISLASLGFHYTSTGELALAEPLLDEAVERGRSVLGAEHPWHTNNLYLLADVYRRTNRNEESVPLYVDAIEVQRATLGDDHYLTLRSMTGLAMAHVRLERYESAETVILQVLQHRRVALGDRHPKTLQSTAALAFVLRASGDHRGSLELLDETLPVAREELAEDSLTLGSMLKDRGICLHALGRDAEAEQALLEAHAVLAAGYGAEHEQTLDAARALVDLYERSGSSADATTWRERLEPS